MAPLDFLSQLRLRNIFGDAPPSPYSQIDFNQPGAPQSLPTNTPAPDVSMSPDTTPPLDTPPDTVGGYDAGKRMSELYHPSTAASGKLADILKNMPRTADYHPSKLRALGGLLTTAGLSFDQHGRFTPNVEAMKAGERFTDEPINKQMFDWQQSVKPAEELAQIERGQNSIDRTNAYNTVASELRQHAEDAKKANDAVNAKIRQQRADTYDFKAKNPGMKIITPKGGNIQAFDPATGQTHDLGIPSGSLTEMDKLNLNAEHKMEQIAATGNEARKTEGVKQTGRVELEGLKDAGRERFAAVKNQLAQFKPTSQTAAMMEGAQMLLPHVNDLNTQATALAQRGMFGPVMSRLREASTKIGTTGTPEDIQRSLDEFSQNILNDPNLTDDFAVNQFTSNLALMASGMGRVHGGSRGGSSIQMVKYLKGVLSGSGSFDSFMGNMSTLNSYLKGYAAGPKAQTNDHIDSAIDRVLGGGKK